MWWITDPKTKEKSVSLTFLTISFVLAIAVNILSVAGKVSSMAATMELLYSFMALYFGRRISAFPGMIDKKGKNELTKV